jgi:putative transposase
MGHHGAPRLSSFEYQGLHSYFVTSCTFDRQTWFIDQAAVEAAREQLLQLSSAHHFDVSAYCFMPDHAHLLLDATSPGSNFRRLMHLWKQATGYAHVRRTGARLWQNGYYEHVLRRDEDRFEVIKYLVANPVRAGLVQRVEEYPFWGSAIWDRDQLLEVIQFSR